MKQTVLIFVGAMLFSTSILAQYQITKTTTLLCDLPECQEEYEAQNDSSSVMGFAATRSLSAMTEKNTASHSESSKAQNVYFIENLNAILFIPQSFTPIESSFNVSGAIGSIIKIQIFNVSKDLVFQTHIVDNAWNGIWKGEPQYGVFNYKITVKVDENSSEVIEGLIVTKKPI